MPAFARYAQLATAARARMAQLEGLGDECQVYANGARVCNPGGPAPAPAPGTTVPGQTVTVCTNEPGPLITNYMVMGARPAGAYGGGAMRWPPIRIRRVCRRIPGPVTQPVQPAPGPATVPAAYTTPTGAPVNNSLPLPAAPVPVDASTGSTIGGIDLSNIPSWFWYALGAGGIYWLFFRKR